MKSLHVIGSRKGGGAERFFARLVAGLNEESTALAVVQPGSEVETWLDDSGSCYPLRMRNNWDLFARWQINKMVKNLSPDIVQTYMGRATRLTHLGRNSGSIHVARLGGYYAVKAYQHPDALVGNTHGICDYLVKQGIPAEKVFYIGNCVDEPAEYSEGQLQLLRRDWKVPEDALLMTSVGRLHQNKGFPDLIDAMAKLPEEINQRPLHLFLVGEGPMRDDLTTQVEQAGLGGRVHFTGWQSEASLFYSACDIAVCPSRHEPLGNVILEAWSHNKPLVTTLNQGAQELVTPGEDGVVAEVKDSVSLSQSIEYALKMGAEDLLQMAQSGYQTLQREHSKDVVVSAYLNLYQKLTGS